MILNYTMNSFDCKDFKNLVNIMAEDWKVKDKAKRKEMTKDLKFIKFMTRFLLICGWGSGVTFAIYRMFLINFSGLNEVSKNSTERLLYVTSEFFFATHISPIYEIIWICQLLTNCFAATAYVIHDGFYMIVVYHLCSQLSVLRLDVRNLICDSKEQTFTVALKPIVQRHLELTR